MKNKTVIITGASRGIGAAAAIRLAAAGWNVVIMAKSDAPHPKLSGTIYTVADEIHALGGVVLPLKVDVRFEDQVTRAVKEAAATFGGIDALINNASALPFDGSEKQLRLVNQVIVDGTRFCTEACLPYLLKSKDSCVINIAPPLPMAEHWIEKYGMYAQAKRTVSEYTTNMAKDYCRSNVLFNTLWPKKMIYTAATINLFGEEKARKRTRRPEIMADAAARILFGDHSGNFFLDEDVLKTFGGMTDFSRYLMPGSVEEDLMPDVFV